MYDFKNKVVLITGGTSGIGLATAKIFKDLSAKVIVTCKTKESFDKFSVSYKGMTVFNDYIQKIYRSNSPCYRCKCK